MVRIKDWEETSLLIGIEFFKVSFILLGFFFLTAFITIGYAAQLNIISKVALHNLTFGLIPILQILFKIVKMFVIIGAAWMLAPSIKKIWFKLIWKKKKQH